MPAMRVLLVHHGTLRDDDLAPLSGGVLRVRVHARALAHAGHEVLTLARAQDDAPATPAPWRALPGFRSPGDLRRLALACAPDAILCVASEEAPALAGIAPLAVDLYAPRLLEGAFEGLQAEEAGRTLAAIQAADEVFVSNSRQRWFFQGLLGAAGWDLSATVGRLVPISAEAGGVAGGSRPPPHDPPTFVIGGHPWPWQDASDTVRRAVAHLRGRARVVSVGMHVAIDGVEQVPVLGRSAWLGTLSTCVAMLDRYAPNPERQLAVGFRQMDALAVGLPLVSDADTPLAQDLRDAGAGWVDAPLEEALDRALDADRARVRDDVLALAARCSPEHTEREVLAWSAAPSVRARSWSLLEAGARLAQAEGVAAREARLREVAESEVVAKRAEVDALHAQVRALTSAVEASAAALADVAGFRREAVAVLGTRLAGREAEAEHLARELAIARAEVEKKTRELEATQADRDRVGGLLRGLRGGR